MFRAATSVQRAPVPVLPGVNTLVKLTVGRSDDPSGPVLVADVPSRVEDLGSDRLIGPIRWADLLWVALPRYDGDVEVPESGTACRVSWPTPVGLYELPTAFEGRERVGPAVRAWRLRVTGPALRVQRRRYVRVAWTGPVTIELPGAVSAPAPGSPPSLDPDVPEPGDVGDRRLAGAMVDLSEGGLRCLLPRPVLPPGTDITVALAVAGRLVRASGQVVWSRPTTTPVGGFAETGIAFDDPDEHGDLLRRAVFSAQVQARRAGLL